MKYSIVIPTYNHCQDLLIPCIESIIRYSNLEDVELIISANGCIDDTRLYLMDLKKRFVDAGIGDHLLVTWSDAPTGYSKATNDGIRLATTDKIILLNNDVLILEQPQNLWLNMLDGPFISDPLCGISGPSKVFSDPAGRDFLIFFCVMISRKVFDTIGLLNEEYGKGGGEDTEFCILAENAGFHLNLCTTQEWSHENNLYVGPFPIYHKGEGTVHDVSLVPDWNDVFLRNSLLLGKKFNPEWYRWRLSNNVERAVYLQGHPVDRREKTRYSWAAQHLEGTNIFEVGCSSGYGLQFMPENITYLGLDYDPIIIEAAKEQNWHPNASFVCANIHEFELGQYDTIIAFESIEHIPNGLELVEKLKNHCKKLIISVPFNESPENFNPHHLVRNITLHSFKDFKEIGLINMAGEIIPPGTRIDIHNEYSLLVEWIKPQDENDLLPASEALGWMNENHPDMYREVITANSYQINRDNISNRNVLDIGANVGAFSLLSAYYGAKKVVALEPVSATFEKLERNIHRSGLKNILAKKNAVTDYSGNYVDISVNPDSGYDSLYTTKSGIFESVETISLADLMNEFEGDNIFMKIDCEGAEYDIILNANAKDMNRVNNIALEIHLDTHPIYKGAEIIENKLFDFGFIQTSDHQIYSWNETAEGVITDYTEIPFRVQTWSRP